MCRSRSARICPQILAAKCERTGFAVVSEHFKCYMLQRRTSMSSQQSCRHGEDAPADFAPDFSKGLVPAIAQDQATGEVLMLAYMNEEAWRKTLETGEAHYWSRSRKELWHKGGTSGHVQKVRSLRLDCDSDTVLLLIEQVGGAACHSGRRSCFYREWEDGAVTVCSPQVFDPQKVYGGERKSS